MISGWCEDCLTFSLGVFGLLQIVAFTQLVRSHVSSKQFQGLLLAAVVSIGVLGGLAMVGLTYIGWIAPWTGRFYSLWDTGYAKKSVYIPICDPRLRTQVSIVSSRYIPIIASVSEHQPTAWPSFYMDLHFLIWLFPAGVVLCFRSLRDEHVFVIIYAVLASYFAGVMVRLMLALTPVVCVTSAVALSSLLDTYLDPAEPGVEDKATEPVEISKSSPAVVTTSTPKKAKKSKDKDVTAPAATTSDDPASSVVSALGTKVASNINFNMAKGIFGLDTRFVVLMNTLGLLLFFVVHCTWVTSNAYSSPSVVLASTSPDGSQHLIDDFREAYYWLRQNTPEDAIVMSWWDYGYQIAGMADRTTLVDNNTWNNSEATVAFLLAFRRY